MTPWDPKIPLGFSEKMVILGDLLSIGPKIGGVPKPGSRDPTGKNPSKTTVKMPSRESHLGPGNTPKRGPKPPLVSRRKWSFWAIFDRLGPLFGVSNLVILD